MEETIISNCGKCNNEDSINVVSGLCSGCEVVEQETDLDLEFERWKTDNEEHLLDKFLDVNDWDSFLQEAWKEYQDNAGLIDKQNKEGAL